MAKPREPDLRYSWFALGLLFVVALFNYVDRTVLSIMQVSLKKDLHLSDTELGTLTGFAFAIFYTTMALPIARLADRVARKYVLVAALAVWTLMTAAGGFANSYASLLACRIGVAVGEAGCVPSTHSLISDLFPPRRRALAMAVWGLSLPLGFLFGFAFGGRLTAALGWRQTFFDVGLSGLVLVPVMLLFLKEPQRGRFDPPALVAAGPRQSVKASLAVLWRIRSFRYLVIGEALQAWTQHAMVAWNAPFYSRLHAAPLAEIATALGLITGLGGAAGTFLGGALVQRLAVRDVRWYMRVPAIAALLTTPFALLQYFTGDLRLSFVAALIPAATVNVYLAPGNAMSQTLAPPHMRAFTSAVFVLVVNIVGLGLGPTSVGMLSDLLASHWGLGDQALRYAVMSAAFPSLAAAVLFWRSSVHLAGEMAPLSAPPVSAIAPSRQPSVASRL